jgi:dTDP-4-dehydrorhamnose 3,5-epimerase
MIEGVRIRRLEPHRDARGSLTELLRSDWSEFTRFGQAILTVNLPGVVRGWHSHRRQTDVIVVIAGRAVVGLYDARAASPTFGAAEGHIVDGNDPVAIFVPPQVFHGYKTLGEAPAFIANFPDQLYDPTMPDEERVPADAPHIPFDWSAAG